MQTVKRPLMLIAKSRADSPVETELRRISNQIEYSENTREAIVSSERIGSENGTRGSVRNPINKGTM